MDKVTESVIYGLICRIEALEKISQTKGKEIENASEKQIKYLKYLEVKFPDGLSKVEARVLIDEALKKIGPESVKEPEEKEEDGTYI